MPIHIKAKKGEVAEEVLIAGDPGRVRLLSNLLEKPQLVNENRSFLVYTGEYKGKRISLAVHGIGGPSAAIVIEELASIGAKTFIRLGTAGSFSEEVKIGDYVIPTGASYNHGGLFGQYLNEKVSIAATPDFSLSSRLIEVVKRKGLRYHLGDIFSSDAFYAEDHDFAKRWRQRGSIAVEMECATLFFLSKIRGLKSAALLVISDNLTNPSEWIDKSALEEAAMKGGEAVLETLAKGEN